MRFRSVLLLACLAPTGAISHNAVAREIKTDRVQQIAEWLPQQPAGLGRPITDRAAWNELARSPAFREMVEHAGNLAAEPFPEMTDEIYLDFSRTGSRVRWQTVDSKRRDIFGKSVFAECLENKGRFLPLIEELIHSICAERTWVISAHDRKLDNFHGRVTEPDLGATMKAWHLATAYHLLGDRLAEATRRLIRENLQRRVLDPVRGVIDGRLPWKLWWLDADQNWNAVCLAGVAGSALAVLESREERAFFVAVAEHYSNNFLSGFTPDGYCSEGLSYWNYGFGHYVNLSEAVRQATDGRLDFLASPAARAPAAFGIRSEILNAIFPTIADCVPGTVPNEQLVSYLCRRFGFESPKCDAPVPSPTPHKLLYTTVLHAFLPERLPAVPGTPLAAESSLRTWFKDGGVLICRPPPDADLEFAVALKGGHNAEHHNHNDVGTYMVVSGASMPLADPGAEVYNARTFTDRYQSDAMNSFGHPVPLIAGKMQRSGREARGEAIRTAFTDDVDTLALDLRSAYEVPSLKRLERTFTYRRRQPVSLTVRDVVEFDEPQTYETALITWGDWKRVDDSEFLINVGAEALRVRIDTAGEPFEISDSKLTADFRAPGKPTRLGLKLKSPVQTAVVTLIIEPVRATAASAGIPE